MPKPFLTRRGFCLGGGGSATYRGSEDETSDLFFAPFRATALQLPEKQIICNGLAAMAAKKIGKIRRSSRKGNPADPDTGRVVPADAVFYPLLLEAF